MWSQLHPNVRTRIKIQFLSRFGSSLIYPFMTIYLAHAYNVQVAGTLVMITVVVSFLAGIYGGHLTDIFGRRKVLVTGEFLKFLSALGILLANMPILHLPLPISALVTYLMMLLGNVASGCMSPASDAMLVDVSTEESRAFMYSISYWATNLSLMLGIMVGGWLFDGFFIWLVLGMLVINAATFILTKFLISETYHVSPTKEKNIGLIAVLKSYKIVLGDLRFLLFTLGGILIMTIEFQRTNYISVHLAENFVKQTFFGLSLDGIKVTSLLTTMNTLIIVLLTAPISKIVSKYSNKVFFVLGTALFAIGYAFQAFSLTLVILFAASLVLSLGELLYVPTRQAKLAEIMNENQRGVYVAVNGTIYKLGQFLAAGMLIISPSVGSLGIFVLILLAGLLAIMISLFALRKEK
jgi:DHA1 family multidrug resistance protein B-like MFS transporter